MLQERMGGPMVGEEEEVDVEVRSGEEALGDIVDALDVLDANVGRVLRLYLHLLQPFVAVS